MLSIGFVRGQSQSSELSPIFGQPLLIEIDRILVETGRSFVTTTNTLLTASPIVTASAQRSALVRAGGLSGSPSSGSSWRLSNTRSILVTFDHWRRGSSEPKTCLSICAQEQLRARWYGVSQAGRPGPVRTF